MKFKAKRTAKWTSGDNSYSFSIGEVVDIKSTDVEKAKASGIFTEVKETKTTTKKG